MTTLTVNGRRIAADIEPRLHLADFLREHLHLTGTHLGCEHGVCGACTLLLDGAPARSCITFAATCAGRDVVSIEGLEDDLVITALRTAFSAEHALQCGYCTPGMLVTARDIIHRLPDADDDRIRLELAGNLCRCTGYNGIVKAIRRVLNLRLSLESSPKKLPTLNVPELSPQAAAAPRAAPRSAGNVLTQRLQIDVPAAALWAALQDPALVASCVPGASLTSVDGNEITGEMAISLGPIQGRFVGSASVAYGDLSGTINGEGQDQISKTRLSAQANFSVAPAGESSTLLFELTYSLRGPLSQFARFPVVQAFATEIAEMVGRNLQAKLRGTQAPPAKRLSAAGLFVRVLWRRVRKLLGSTDDH
jgi:carbon-monoxide dehydrogenase small subunit